MHSSRIRNRPLQWPYLEEEVSAHQGGVCLGGVSATGCVCLGGVCTGGVCLGGSCPGGCTPLCGQTDTFENITFLQLLLRTLKSLNTMSTAYDEHIFMK